MSDADTTGLRKALVVLGRAIQFVLAALAGILAWSGLVAESNLILALAFGVFALVLLAFAGVVEAGVRWVRPAGAGA